MDLRFNCPCSNYTFYGTAINRGSIATRYRVPLINIQRLKLYRIRGFTIDRNTYPPLEAIIDRNFVVNDASLGSTRIV